MLSFFEKHSKLSWSITFIGAVLIFYISSLTFGGYSSGTGILSILYHFLAFFCFSFFLFISITKGKANTIKFFVGILISIAYAVSDEVHQFFVPERYSSLFDVFIDSTGILYAFMIYFIIILYRNKK